MPGKYHIQTSGASLHKSCINKEDGVFPGDTGTKGRTGSVPETAGRAAEELPSRGSVVRTKHGTPAISHYGRGKTLWAVSFTLTSILKSPAPIHLIQQKGYPCDHRPYIVSCACARILWCNIEAKRVLLGIGDTLGLAAWSSYNVCWRSIVMIDWIMVV